MNQSKKAFTMMELIFVIVIIGILTAVAVPRLAATRDDAEITKARVLIASVRSAVSMERQKRILRGDFDPIFRLTDSTTLNKRIFNLFDGVEDAEILENPPFSCTTLTDTNCWRETQTGTLDGARNTDKTDDSQYTYNLPTGGSEIFTIYKNKFQCLDKDSTNCRLLTQ